MYNILILGASYGSLLGTKMAMAGHNVSLLCRDQTAALINSEGTFVRLKLRGGTEPRIIASKDLPGRIDAVTTDTVDPTAYDMVALAMQEPQYAAPAVKALMRRVADAKIPCLSIMNMPPLPYLKRVTALADADLVDCFTDASVWDGFDPGLVSLCSPDPQAFRPPEEKANFLHVGLPTNFKAAEFADAGHNEMLRNLEQDILALTIEDQDVPVKLRVFDSLYVPFAKWSMLLTGNYRCVGNAGVVSIRDAVHGNIEESRAIYAYVDELVRKLGADPADQVPFEKYAKAAENLLKPSSAARAIDAGAERIERVDRVVQAVGARLGVQSDDVDRIVAIVDARLAQNAAQKVA